METTKPQPLHERFRPRQWSDYVGQPKALAALEAIRRVNGTLAGQAYWISGVTGIGKTTLARLIAGEISDEFTTIEADAGDCTADSLRELERTWCQYGWGKGGRAYIFNEAHRMRAAIVGRWLTMLENQPAHVVVIFTTTNDGEQMVMDGIDGKPLIDRCTRLALTSQGLCKPFAVRAKAIAESVGLDGQPIEKYERLMKDCNNSPREAIQRIGAGCMMEG